MNLAWRRYVTCVVGKARFEPTTLGYLEERLNATLLARLICFIYPVVEALSQITIKQ